MLSRTIALSTMIGFATPMLAPAPAKVTHLVVATVDNAQMIELERLTRYFEQANPDIRISWVTLDEDTLRSSVSTDISTQGGQYDIATIGTYETPLWAQRGWLVPIHPDAGYDTADLLPAIRASLSYRNELYAAPIYGESSMLMYRKDLLHKAGLSMPARPTWKQVAAFAARLDDPRHGVYGICLRGKPGWGENMTLVTTMVNTFGGQWFDMQWKPQLQTPAWRDAVGLYVDLLRHDGPPDAATLGYNQNLALFEQGRCAMWVGATVAAGYVTDVNLSKVASEVGFAQAPVAVTPKGSHWLWAWALAIPADTDAAHRAAARRFIDWATSRAYVKRVASHDGWALAPPGTRASTYANPAFRAAAPWAGVVLRALDTADPDDATLHKAPYAGVQFAVIPSFRAIGDEVGRYVSEAVAGRLSVDQALARSQHAAERDMMLAGRRQ